MDDSGSTWRIIVACTLIAVNAFFVASEFAIAKIRPNRMRELAEKGHHAASTAYLITKNADSYLSACQLGVTMSSIALGWISGPAISSLFQPVFSWFHVQGTLSLAFSGILGYGLITFAHTVAGAQVPKSLAVCQAEVTALRVAVPLRVFYILSYPGTWLINTAASICLHLVGVEETTRSGGSHTEDEIRDIVTSSQQCGVLEEQEVELVENILDYTDRVAREIMTPRNDVTILHTEQTLEEAARYVLAEGYTRYPLCQGERDRVVGIVHIRDIFALLLAGEQKSLEEIAREPLIVPETLLLPLVRARFQASGMQMAVVVDEYGAFSGIVTVEDLVEEVFGDMRDEFDEIAEDAVRATDKGFELDAGMMVEEALEVLGITGEVEVEGVDTIGGLVFSLLADKPEVGDNVEVDGYRLEVAEVDGLRITRIIATLLQEPDQLPPVDTPS